jgi:hypothetical protein
MKKIISFSVVTDLSALLFRLIETVFLFKWISLSYNRFRIVSQALNVTFGDVLIETPSRLAFNLLWILKR